MTPVSVRRPERPRAWRAASSPRHSSLRGSELPQQHTKAMLARGQLDQAALFAAFGPLARPQCLFHILSGGHAIVDLSDIDSFGPNEEPNQESTRAMLPTPCHCGYASRRQTRSAMSAY